MEKIYKFHQIYSKMSMKKMFNKGNQIHNFISSSGSGTVNYLLTYDSYVPLYNRFHRGEWITRVSNYTPK